MTPPLPTTPPAASAVSFTRFARAFGLGLLAHLGLAQAHAAATQARMADAFVDSVGVHMHANYLDLVPYSTGWPTTKQRLVESGIRHIRDGFYDNNTANPRLIDLAVTHGIRATLVFDTRSNGLLDQSQIAARLHMGKTKTWNVAGANRTLTQAIEAIEGPNEYDNSPDPNWIANLRAYQLALYQAVAADPAYSGFPVLAPALARTTQIGNLGSMLDRVDVGNAHPYPGNQPPASDSLSTYLRHSQTVWPGLPLHVSETGYTNATANGGVTEAVAAKYGTRLLLNYFRRGVERTFIHELADLKPGASPTARESNWGLLRNDSSPKPIYTALKNLLQLLNDPGPAFTPGHFGYALSGSTADICDMLLQKRDGSYWLVLWVEKPSWNPSTATQITVPAQTVTVTLTQPALSPVAVYRPLLGTSATNVALSSGAFQVSVADEPVLIRIQPSHPSASLITYDGSSLAGLTQTNWIATTLNPALWLGDATAWRRSSDTATNSIVFSAPRIDHFTARIGLGWNTTTASGVTFDYHDKVVFHASTNGSTWTPVPAFRGIIDKTETEQAQASARWLTEMSPAGALPAGTNYVRLTVPSTTGSENRPLIFQFDLSQTGTYEGESLARTLSGGFSTSHPSTPDASNGMHVLATSSTNGQWMEILVPHVPPGTYALRYRYRTSSTRGIIQASWEGANVGPAIDQSVGPDFIETTLGTVTTSTHGSRLFRLTVVGKNPASSSRTMSLDRIVLVKQ